MKRRDINSEKSKWGLRYDGHVVKGFLEFANFLIIGHSPLCCGFIFAFFKRSYGSGRPPGCVDRKNGGYYM